MKKWLINHVHVAHKAKLARVYCRKAFNHYGKDRPCRQRLALVWRSWNRFILPCRTVQESSFRIVSIKYLTYRSKSMHMLRHVKLKLSWGRLRRGYGRFLKQSLLHTSTAFLKASKFKIPERICFDKLFKCPKLHIHTSGLSHPNQTIEIINHKRILKSIISSLNER